MELLKDIGLLILPLILLNMLGNCLMGILVVPSIKIRLKKKAKFLTSKEPLYKIELTGAYGDNYYSVSKWVLDYIDNGPSYLLIFLFPYPITILHYGYDSIGVNYYIDTEKTPLSSVASLMEFYESKAEVDRLEKEKENEVTDINTIGINRLNSEYNENYK